MVERPDLESPVLIMVLKGWIDAGLGADGAADVLTEQLDRRTVARFDADALLDWRARRPTMRLVDGVNTQLTWEETELSWAKDGLGHDVLLLFGNEPDHAWLAFSEQVVDLADDLGARMVLGLGAYPTPVPHTRTPLLAASASSDELAQGLHPELRRGAVRGAGDDRAPGRAARPARARPLGPGARTTCRPCPTPRRRSRCSRAPTASPASTCPLGDLPDQADASRRRIDELIAQNPEHAAMLEQLEAQADQQASDTALQATSGDELAAELERFLREQGRN